MSILDLDSGTKGKKNGQKNGYAEESIFIQQGYDKDFVAILKLEFLKVY